jgi:phosphoglycerate dehydrogenase-like enzyme
MGNDGNVNRGSALSNQVTPICILPDDERVLIEAVVDAGGRITRAEKAEVLVSFSEDVDFIRCILHPGIRWVQLGWAGVDKWIRAGVIDRERVWTSCRGVFGPPIAQHTLAFILAAASNLPERIRARQWGRETWGGREGRRLLGATVGIIGCGGIGEALIELLQPFRAVTICLTHSGRAVPGATVSVGKDGLDHLLGESDYVVIAAPYTPSTAKLISREQLALMRKTAWLINVSRGAIVDTGALVDALATGGIGGAALDVVEPEPLPDDHPLWRLANVVITPHTACSRSLSLELFAVRLRENLRRFRAGEEVLGIIDLDKGY